MRIKLFITSLFLLFFVQLTSAAITWDGTSAAWTNGSGTEADPYLIESPIHLAYLATQINAGTSYAGVYFKQTQDFNFNSRSWTAIGTSSSPFDGVYDGNNKQMKGISLIFSYIKDAIIRNLKISGRLTYVSNGVCLISNVHCDAVISTSYSGEDSFGALCSTVSSGYLTVDRCSFSGSITVSSTTQSNSKSYECAGLVGNGNGKTTISRCCNVGTIKVESGNSSSSFDYFKKASTCGLAFNADRITQSYNAGSVSTKRGTNALSLAIGTANTIDHCYTRFGGSASSGTYTYSYLLGRASSLYNCYATSNVSSSYNRDYYYAAREGVWNVYVQGLVTAESGVEVRSSDFMKTDEMLSQLNTTEDIFVKDYGNINDGYPVFQWQLESLTLYNLRATCPSVQGTVTGGGKYPMNSNVTIKATPKDGYVFTGWSDGNTDNPRSVTVTADATYVAQFTQNAYTVYVNQDCTTSVE